MVKAQKLAIFVKKNPRCKVCSTEFVDEIHKLRLEGKTFREIVEFAKERGVDLNEQNLSTHFRFHFVIPKVKRQEILDKISRSLVPTLAVSVPYDIDELISKDIDFVNSLKILITKKVKTLSDLEEKLEQIEKGEEDVSFKERLFLQRLILETERGLVELLEKLENKRDEYKDIDVLRNFILRLVPLINELEEKSSEKELVKDFRLKVSNLVKGFENG